MHLLRRDVRARRSPLGIADAVAAYEAAPDRGGDVTDEVALTLLVILARRHPDATPFGPYALALPRDPPDTPLLFPAERLRAVVPILPLALVDAVDDARQELFQLWDVAAAVIDRVVFPGGEGTPAGTPEPPLDVDEFAFAWLAVRSRPSRSPCAARTAASTPADAWSPSWIS